MNRVQNAASADTANRKDRKSGGKTDGGGSPATGRIRAFRFVYGALALIYFACIVLQVFFAGMGVFVNADDLQLHRAFANDFEYLSLLMFVISFFGGIRGGLRWYTLGLLALTMLQHMTVRVLPGALAALHTVDALALFWISLHLMRRSWPWLLMRPDKAATNA